MQFIGHEGSHVGSVAFSPDGKRIVTGSWDRTARVWDAATGMKLMIMRGHGDSVQSVAFSPDGKRIVTGSWDRTARIWDLSTGSELLKLPAHHFVRSVAFSPDGKTVAGGTWGKTILLWDSAAPVGGYEPRKTAVEARNLVDELHDTHGFYYDVIDKLKADKTLDEQVRRVALQIANSRKIEDEEKKEEPTSDDE